MTDTYGHTLNSGKKYCPGKYLQKVQSRKSNKKQFQFIIIIIIIQRRNKNSSYSTKNS